MTACERVDRWLEAGGASAAPLPEDALAHAARCARCAARLAAEREIEALLSAPPAAPAGFTAEVMRRVMDSAAPAARARRAAPLPPAPAALPLWVRVAADPAVVLASLVAAGVAWKASALLALAGTLAGAFSERLAGPLASAAPRTAHALSAFMRPEVGLGLLTALAVPLAWVSWLLYESLSRLPHAPGTPRR